MKKHATNSQKECCSANSSNFLAVTPLLLQEAKMSSGSFPVCSGNYEGPEPERLATLKLAAMKKAPYVDVEFKAAAIFFAGRIFKLIACFRCFR